MGGTVILPGTHLASTVRPLTATMEHHSPPWPAEFYEEPFHMAVVQLEPGQCLIFSKRLLHASKPYTGLGQRRTVFFYKYMPEGAQREDVPVRRRFYLALPGLSEAQKVIMSWPDGERPPPSARQCTCSCCWGGQAMSWHHDGAIAVGCSCQSNKFGIPHCLV